MPAPPGVTPDFNGTSHLQRTILAVYISTFILATITLGLRVWTRAFLMHNMALDDCKSSSEMDIPKLD